MLVNTRSCSYYKKNEGGPQKTTIVHNPSSLTSKQSNTHNTLNSIDHLAKIVQQPRATPSSSSTSYKRYNILKHMAIIKADVAMLDMVVFHEQQEHLE
jgi:hypothetical protein